MHGVNVAIVSILICYILIISKNITKVSVVKAYDGRRNTRDPGSIPGRSNIFRDKFINSIFNI